MGVVDFDRGLMGEQNHQLSGGNGSQRGVLIFGQAAGRC